MRISRDDRSIMADWWFTVDKVFLVAVFLLMAAGVVASLAASPIIAVKRGLDPYYYVERHVVFTILSAAAMLVISLLSPVGVRRFALGLSVVLLAALVAVPFIGIEVNGAARWLRVMGQSFQPSEFYKPVFVVAMAWLFALSQTRHDKAALSLAVAVFILSAACLIAQPDVGQTLLISVSWGVLFALSGQPLKRVYALGGLGLAGAVGAYLGFDHVRQRIDRFLDPSSGDTYQTDRALRSFLEGGFFGRGPGEGTIKHALPDAHTDFIFAVIAEEYGILACLVLLGLFAFIVIRALIRVMEEPDAFTRNAVVGLSSLFALHAAINMAVNVGLMPAKGMTLPFVSAGGSSMLALGLLMGMILALTRYRPDRSHHKMPKFTARSAMGPLTVPGFEPAAGSERPVAFTAHEQDMTG